jgi:gephyrin
MDEAMKMVLEISQPLESVTLDVKPSLAGHVLSEDVTSSQQIPSSPTTNVDGYAVQGTAVYPNLLACTHRLPWIYAVPYKKGAFKVLTPASLAPSTSLPPDSIYRINTGAPLPPGANAVIMVEDTRVDSQFTAQEGQEGEEKTVELRAEVDIGENVRKAGSDVRAGDRVLAAGDAITSLGGEIGTLAFVGRKQVCRFCFVYALCHRARCHRLGCIRNLWSLC